MTIAAAAIPYIAAGVKALGSLAVGAIKKRQANKKALPEQDPSQLAMLDEINRKRSQLEQGVGAEYDLLNKQISQQQAQTQQNVLRGAGGDIGATMQGLNMSQQAAGMAYAQGSSPLIQKSGQYQMLAKQMVDDIAQRKFEVQQWQKIQKMREAAEQTQAGSQNLFPALLGTVYTQGNDKTRGILGGLMGIDQENQDTTIQQPKAPANMSINTALSAGFGKPRAKGWGGTSPLGLSGSSIFNTMPYYNIPKINYD